MWFARWPDFISYIKDFKTIYQVPLMQMRFSLNFFFNNCPLRNKNQNILMKIFLSIVYVLWFPKNILITINVKKNLLTINMLPTKICYYIFSVKLEILWQFVPILMVWIFKNYFPIDSYHLLMFLMCLQ